DDLLIDGYLGLQRVLEVAGQLLLLEQFLSVVVLIPNALITNAVNQSQALGPVDCFSGKVDELLRVLLEVVEAATPCQDFDEAPARQLRLVLKVCEQIG